MLSSLSTGPYAIRSLEAETLNTTTVNLTWMEPVEYKAEYRYQIETTGCGPQSKLVAEQVAQISGLTPGTNCTFCISVRAENGIEGEAVCTSQYTSKIFSSVWHRHCSWSVLVILTLHIYRAWACATHHLQSGLQQFSPGVMEQTSWECGILQGFSKQNSTRQLPRAECYHHHISVYGAVCRDALHSHGSDMQWTLQCNIWTYH